MDPHQEKKWFVYLTDHHEGPFSLEEVRSKLDDNVVSSAHYFWCDGMTDWQVMTEIDELAELLRPQKPPSSPKFSTPQDIKLEPEDEPAPEFETQYAEESAGADEGSSDSALETMELGTALSAEATETVPVESVHKNLPTAELSVDAPPEENQNFEDDSSIDLPKLEEASQSMEVADPHFEENFQTQDGTFPGHGESEDDDFSRDTHGNLEMPQSSGKTGKISVQPNFSSTLSAEPSRQDSKTTAAPLKDRDELDQPREKKSKGALKKLLLIGIVLGGLYYAYEEGWFRNLTGPDSIIRKSSEQLVEWVPSLSKWMSPVPDLADVDPIEYRFLEQAAYADPKEGFKTAIALSNSDLKTPHFYVGSNLPDFTRLEVHVVGVEETLLNHYDVHLKEDLILKNHWGRTKSFTFDSGTPLPTGQYDVYVFEADNQDRTVQDALNTLSPSNEKLGSDLPENRRIVFKKSYFLGGEKDDQYEKRLKTFHDRLQEKAKAEIEDLKSVGALLKTQTESLFDTFDRLRKAPPAKARKDWEQFDRKWRQDMVPLDAVTQKWSSPAAMRTLYHGRVYQIITELVPAIKQLEAKFGTYFSRPPSDLKQFEIDFSHDKSRFETSIATLQAVINRIEKTQPSPNGMPVRLPLKNNT